MLSSLQDLSLACHTPAILLRYTSGDLKTHHNHTFHIAINTVVYFLCFHILVAIWPCHVMLFETFNLQKQKRGGALFITNQHENRTCEVGIITLLHDLQI